MADEHEAIEADLAWSLAWSDTNGGGLRGRLIARNVSAHAVRLSGKPGLMPLDRDGAPLGPPTIVTLELRTPGYVVIEPGATVSAPVGWAGWDGAEPSGRVIVRWRGGEAVIAPDGPRRPRRTEPPTMLSSSWFEAD
jgi:hypothetical protein